MPWELAAEVEVLIAPATQQLEARDYKRHNETPSATIRVKVTDQIVDTKQGLGLWSVMAAKLV